MKIKLKSFGNRKQSFNTPGRFGYEINSLHITKLKYLSKSKPLNDLATPNKHQILPERFPDFPLFQENTDETPDLTILRVCDLRDACFQNDEAP